MVKRISLIRRVPGMSDEAFERYWLNEHIKITKQYPGLKKYIINITDRRLSPDAEWDGFSELWYDSVENMRLAYTGEIGQRSKEDEKNFIGEISVMVIEEHPII
ncbi:MAG: EthD family reductase [Vulcanimicrobiaceae bacterium]